MSERNITYLTDACIITCIVEMGSAEKVLEAAKIAGHKVLLSTMHVELVLEKN